MTLGIRLRRPRLLTAVSLVVALAAAAPALAEQPLPDTPDQSTWTTDGTVQAIATLDGVTYVGGSFNYVGPSTGAAVIAAPDTGALVGDPGVAGSVSDAEPDGAGGVYLAGSFIAAGGFTRSNVVHLLADGSVDPAFDPGPVNGPAFGANPVAVHTLLLDAGRLYVGGTFDTIDGVARTSLAALDPATGDLLAFDPSVTTTAGEMGVVHALAPVTGDDSIYVGGLFDRVGASRFPNLARVTSAGVALSSFAGDEPDGEVYALKVAGTTLYAGGSFSRLGASAGAYLRRYTTFPAHNIDRTWLPVPDGTVRVLDTVDGQSSVYVAGFFTRIGANGITRAGFGEIRVADGNATTWNPAPAGTFSGSGTGSINALRVVGGTVWIGGNFTSAGGEARDGLVAVDQVGGGAQPGGFSVGGPVYALETTATGKLVVAGDFNSVQGVRRRDLAALGADGRVTAWNPRSDGTVAVLQARGSRIWAGGDFDVIGGAARTNLALLSPGSDAALPFDPAPDGVVRALLLSPDGGTLYVGGLFRNIGAPQALRPRLAALDPDTGAARAWNPQPDAGVEGLALGPGGGPLYVAGSFANVGSPPVARDSLAAMTTDTGAPTPLSVVVDGGGVVTVLPRGAGGDVVVGGTFSQLGGQLRRGVGALSAAGALGPFNPAPVSNAVVRAIEPTAGGTLLLGGSFIGLGATDRRLLAEVDAATGVPTAWNPRLSFGTTGELLVDGRNLWVGTTPGAVDLRSSGGLLRFVRPAEPAGPPAPGPGPGGSPSDTTAPALTRLSLARARFAVGSRPTAPTAAARRRSAPTGTTIRFTLSERATVRIEIQRAAPGRRSRGSCRRPSARLSARPSCTRWVAAGVLTRRGLAAGRQAIPFTGRLGRRALAAGRYRFALTATDPTGNRSPARTIAFRVVRA